MSNPNELPEEEKFSDDPEENLRLENNFLKMKMMAESGGIIGSGGDRDIPPEIENQFLKQVIEFERAYANAKPQKIVEILGNPSFENEKELDEKKFKREFARLNKLLKDHNINVDFTAPRDDRFKYHFITRELFYHETDFVAVKGMTTNFLYEEFHPDHELDIKNLADQFLNDYFEKKLDENTFYISDQFIEPNGNVLSREELMKQFQAAYDVFTKLDNASFTIENIDFELNGEKGDGQQGMGFCEGEIRYDIIFNGREIKKVYGPYKIYFSLRWDCWEIYFFYLPGFNYHPANE